MISFNCDAIRENILATCRPDNCTVECKTRTILCAVRNEPISTRKNIHTKAFARVNSSFPLHCELWKFEGEDKLSNRYKAGLLDNECTVFTCANINIR